MLESEFVISEIGEWLDSLVHPDICFWCGQKYRYGPSGWNGREVHHIKYRWRVPKRERDHPCNLFACHSQCHQPAVHAADAAKVLARKLLSDPEHFDLQKWLSLGDPTGKEANRVTLREITKYLRVHPPFSM